MNKKFLITVATLVIIIAAAVVAVFLIKGYTFSPKEGVMTGTGIISVASVPDGASVYVDDHLTTASNANISHLPPRSYKVKILKEGFIPWEKEVEVKEGLVTEIKATLFPSLPTIYPLTFNGVSTATLSPDGSKLAFAVPSSSEGAHIRQKGGVWVWTMGNTPISFSRSAEPHQITASTPSLDFTKASFKFSPDSKELLVTIQEGDQVGQGFERNFLLNVEQFTSATDARDITPMVETTLKTWTEEVDTKNTAMISAIPKIELRKIASDSAVLKWSPDESKFIVGNNERSNIKDQLRSDRSQKSNPVNPDQIGIKSNPKLDSNKKITPTPILLDNYHVYDLLTGKNYTLPPALSYHWLPDSKHIILVNEGRVSVVEFDGTNEGVLFAGKFEASYVFPWPDSSRIVIVSSYDTPTGSKPNFFGINLK